MNYRIRAAGKTLEVYIYDYIGGWMAGVTPQQIANDLKAAGKIDLINVRINSPGGDVYDGITIHNILKRHPARVEVDIDGLCGSIATVVAMAADEIRIADNGTFMIHQPMTGMFGTVEDMRIAVERLELAEEQILDMYVAKTGGDREHLAELMRAETWMSASRAKEEGFVDEITDELELAACFDLSRYRNAPKHLHAAAGPPTPNANIFRAKLAANASKVQRICGGNPQ
jgi:ATP-dependent Clp protease protease subunit